MEKNRKYLDQAAILLSPHRTFLELNTHIQAIYGHNILAGWKIILFGISSDCCRSLESKSIVFAAE